MRWPWELRNIQFHDRELIALLAKAAYLTEKVDDLVATMNSQLDVVERQEASSQVDGEEP